MAFFKMESHYENRNHRNERQHLQVGSVLDFIAHLSLLTCDYIHCVWLHFMGYSRCGVSNHLIWWCLKLRNWLDDLNIAYDISLQFLSHTPLCVSLKLNPPGLDKQQTYVPFTLSSIMIHPACHWQMNNNNNHWIFDKVKVHKSSNS